MKWCKNRTGDHTAACEPMLSPTATVTDIPPAEPGAVESLACTSRSIERMPVQGFRPANERPKDVYHVARIGPEQESPWPEQQVTKSSRRETGGPSRRISCSTRVCRRSCMERRSSSRTEQHSCYTEPSSSPRKERNNSWHMVRRNSPRKAAHSTSWSASTTSSIRPAESSSDSASGPALPTRPEPPARRRPAPTWIGSSFVISPVTKRVTACRRCMRRYRDTLPFRTPTCLRAGDG